MKKLGERNYALISQGAKITGDYIEAYYYCEEQLYVGESPTIFRFLTWCKENNKPFGHGNYEQRFSEFLKTIN